MPISPPIMATTAIVNAQQRNRSNASHDIYAGLSFAYIGRPMASPPDPVRQLIKRRLEETPLSMAALSREMGHSAAYLQQWLTRDDQKKTELRDHDRAVLSARLNVREEDLRGPRTRAALAKAAKINPPAQQVTAARDEVDAEEIPLETLTPAQREAAAHATGKLKTWGVYRVISHAIDVYYPRGTLLVVDLDGFWGPRDLVLAQRADGGHLLRQAIDPLLVAPTTRDPKPATIFTSRDGVSIIGLVVMALPVG